MGDARSSFHRLVLFGGILVTAIVLVGYGTSARAQQTTPTDQTQPKIQEEVTVTGTLIPRPTIEAMSPVTTMDVETLSYRGLTRLEDIMQTLPQVFVAQNSSISNGATGTATIDLRNIGDVRTLVLIDGERMQSGDTGDVAGDLNFIPASLVKRIDILTGGASATYGADAVAGVVNFILDTDFEGFRAGLNGGGYQHNNNDKTEQALSAAAGFPYPSGNVWDGGTGGANLAWGGKFADGKGHAMLYIDFQKTAQLLKGARDYYNCSENPSDNGPVCAGSPTNATGHITPYNADFTNSSGDFTVGPNGTLVPFGPQAYFNYGPYNSIQRPDERYTGGAFINYDWNQHFKGYGSVMLMNDSTNAQIAPGGVFYAPYQVNCNNPMLTANEYQNICVDNGYGPTDLANVIIARRDVEGSPRTAMLDHDAIRLLAGLKGEIDKDWSYDVHAMNAQTKITERDLGYFYAPNIQNALLVNSTDPNFVPGSGSGANSPSTWQCQSGSPCVPYDLFQKGYITQAALNYLYVPVESQGLVQTQLITGKVSGDLKDYGLVLPSATEGIHLAVGAEYRKEYLDFEPDYVIQNGLNSGGAGAIPPTHGFYDVKEGFAEALIPLIQGYRGARDLSLSLGYRYSDYNINGSHPTYKAEADWAPTVDFKFRAGYNRATRAPNVNDLYSPQAVVLTSGNTDPCVGPADANGLVNGFTEAQCARSGVTPAQFGHLQANPAEQYNYLSGGNPNLTPETADTKTFGLVITPENTSLTAAFDYYDIKITNVISNLAPQDIITTCVQTGNPSLCALIHRDQLGSLWITPQGYIQATEVNIAELEEKGVDANITYNVPLGKSLLGFNLIGSYTDTYLYNTGLYSYDCVGYYGNTCNPTSGPSPKWRHYLRVSWETGPVVVNLGWRYIGALTADVGSPNPHLSDPTTAAEYAASGDLKIPAYNYIDLAVSLKVGPSTQLMIGCNNIADKEPPVFPGYGGEGLAAGMFGTYDPAGRFVFANINFNL